MVISSAPKILIFGGAGYIGSQLGPYLCSIGHSVLIVDVKKPTFWDPKINADYICINLNDSSAINDIFEGHNIKSVVYLASVSTPSTSDIDICSDISSNLIASVSFMEIAAKFNIDKFIYFSSGGAIYGDMTNNIGPLSELSSTNPITSYGVTKLAFEKYLQYFSHNFGFTYGILRVGNPYGRLSGSSPQAGFISALIRSAISENTLDIWGDGYNVRDYIHISDVVRAVAMLITSQGSHLLNIGSGRGYTENDLIKMVEEINNSPVKVKYLPRRISDIRSVILDPSKALQELGWTPFIEIKEGLKKEIFLTSDDIC